jgi:hypothetical protein
MTDSEAAFRTFIVGNKNTSDARPPLLVANGNFMEIVEAPGGLVVASTGSALRDLFIRVRAAEVRTCKLSFLVQANQLLAHGTTLQVVGKHHLPYGEILDRGWMGL